MEIVLVLLRRPAWSRGAEVHRRSGKLINSSKSSRQMPRPISISTGENLNCCLDDASVVKGHGNQSPASRMSCNAPRPTLIDTGRALWARQWQSSSLSSSRRFFAATATTSTALTGLIRLLEIAAAKRGCGIVARQEAISSARRHIGSTGNGMNPMCSPRRPRC
jgi:hypothetical protein